MSIHTASLGTIDQPRQASAARPKRLVCDFIRQWADAHRYWIFACILFMFMAGFTGRWEPESDSALYLALGRSLALGNGYTDLGQPNHLVYPGLPWLIAGTFKIFGVDHLFPIHLLMIFFASAALAMMYAMVMLRIDRPTAVVVTSMVALSDTFFRYSMKILTDMPFMAGVMAVLLGCELIGWNREKSQVDPPRREKPSLGWIFIILGLALATIMRPVIWALLITLLLGAIFSAINRKGQWKFVLIAAAALLMIGAFFLLDPRRAGGSGLIGNYESSILESIRSGDIFQRGLQNLSMVLGGITTEALLGMRIGPGLNQVAAVLAIALAIALWRRQPLWSLWVIISLGMMLAVLPVRRYYLSILPFFMLGCWIGIGWLNRTIRDRNIANILSLALVILLAGSNVVRCANFSLQQHGIYIGAKSDKQSEDAMITNLSRKMIHKLPANATILSPRRYARVLGYLGGRHTIAAGSNVQFADLHAPAYVILPINGKDLLMQNDLDRLGIKPGRQIFVENATSDFQYAVYEIK